MDEGCRELSSLTVPTLKKLCGVRDIKIGRHNTKKEHLISLLQQNTLKESQTSCKWATKDELMKLGKPDLISFVKGSNKNLNVKEANNMSIENIIAFCIPGSESVETKASEGVPPSPQSEIIKHPCIWSSTQEAPKTAAVDMSQVQTAPSTSPNISGTAAPPTADSEAKTPDTAGPTNPSAPEPEPAGGGYLQELMSVTHPQPKKRARASPKARGHPPKEAAGAAGEGTGDGLAHESGESQPQGDSQAAAKKRKAPKKKATPKQQPGAVDPVAASGSAPAATAAPSEETPVAAAPKKTPKKRARPKKAASPESTAPAEDGTSATPAAKKRRGNAEAAPEDIPEGVGAVPETAPTPSGIWLPEGAIKKPVATTAPTGSFPEEKDPVNAQTPNSEPSVKAETPKSGRVPAKAETPKNELPGKNEAVEGAVPSRASKWDEDSKQDSQGGDIKHLEETTARAAVEVAPWGTQQLIVSKPGWAPVPAPAVALGAPSNDIPTGAAEAKTRSWNSNSNQQQQSNNWNDWNSNGWHSNNQGAWNANTARGSSWPSEGGVGDAQTMDSSAGYTSNVPATAAGAGANNDPKNDPMAKVRAAVERQNRERESELAEKQQAQEQRRRSIGYPQAQLPAKRQSLGAPLPPQQNMQGGKFDANFSPGQMVQKRAAGRMSSPPVMQQQQMPPQMQEQQQQRRMSIGHPQQMSSQMNQQQPSQPLQQQQMYQQQQGQPQQQQMYATVPGQPQQQQQEMYASVPVQQQQQQMYPPANAQSQQIIQQPPPPHPPANAQSQQIIQQPPPPHPPPMQMISPEQMQQGHLQPMQHRQSHQQQGQLPPQQQQGGQQQGRPSQNQQQQNNHRQSNQLQMQQLPRQVPPKSREWSAAPITYLPVKITCSRKTITPCLRVLVFEGFHSQQFCGEYHMVDGARVLGKSTFWRRPNLDVFVHHYPYTYARAAISMRSDYEAANGPDHDPLCYQVESTSVWMEKVTLNEIETIALSGFQKSALNGTYVRDRRNGQPVEIQGNPVYWNTTKKYFIYSQCQNLSRVAIAGRMDFNAASSGDNPAFAYVDNTVGWCEHNGFEYVNAPLIEMKIIGS